MSDNKVVVDILGHTACLFLTMSSEAVQGAGIRNQKASISGT